MFLEIVHIQEEKEKVEMEVIKLKDHIEGLHLKIEKAKKETEKVTT